MFGSVFISDDFKQQLAYRGICTDTLGDVLTEVVSTFKGSKQFLVDELVGVLYDHAKYNLLDGEDGFYSYIFFVQNQCTVNIYIEGDFEKTLYSHPVSGYQQLH